MRICNAYSLLKEQKEVTLKNNTFKGIRAWIHYKDNDIVLSFLNRNDEVIISSKDNGLVDNYQLYCAFMQSEKWELEIKQDKQVEQKS